MCVANCHTNHPESAHHKTCEAAIVRWRKHHSHPWSWTYCDAAASLQVTTAELCQAVIGIDLADEPLPARAAHHMLPKSLPSHPKGLDKRLFKHPYWKTLTPQRLACRGCQHSSSTTSLQAGGGSYSLATSLKATQTCWPSRFTPLPTSRLTSPQGINGMRRLSPQSAATRQKTY